MTEHSPNDATDLPWFISVDDHVLEPPDLWTARLPARWRQSGPRVERAAVTGVRYRPGLGWEYDEAPAATAAGEPADVWVYEDVRRFLHGAMCAVGTGAVDPGLWPVTYEQHVPDGAWQQAARLADMDRNHTAVSLCFPSVAQFAGQLFTGRKDPELALACIRVYNDWMIDEWCAGDGRERLVPVTIVPLWDPELAATEVRRCAAKGSHAVTFTECPTNLGLPSLYSGMWDPFVAACDETDTVINLHVGSSSRLPSTAPDAVHAVSMVLLWEYGMHAALDWIMSGTMQRFPRVRLVLSEVQVGWMPFVFERADNVWHQRAAVEQALDAQHDRVLQPPSSYIPGRIFGCIYDDVHGLRCRDQIGIGQILFETDYPHADSTWGHSVQTVRKMCDAADLNELETWRLLRGNAIAAFRLDQYFGITS